MIRTIVQCDICGNEIVYSNNTFPGIRAMPTDGCEMHFHLKCFQDSLNKLMESSPHCNQKINFMKSIINGKFVDGWNGGL